MTNLIRRNALASIGVLVVLVLSLTAIVAPWVVPYDPSAQDLQARLSGPSWEHLFGTDELGRDIFSRILMGARVSMQVGASVVSLSAFLGVLVGGTAGFLGGRIDWLVAAIIIPALLAFPGILLAIALVAFLGPGLGKLILALSAIGWVAYARLARGQVLKTKALDFVEAARALGASRTRTFLWHILPNIVQPLLVQASIGMAVAIMAEASLSFLGLGITPPTASWGSMLSAARTHLFDAPHMVLFPSLVLMATVLSLNFIGDAMRDWLDPRATPPML